MLASPAPPQNAFSPVGPPCPGRSGTCAITGANATSFTNATVHVTKPQNVSFLPTAYVIMVRRTWSPCPPGLWASLHAA